jgi:DNA-binding NtrC family response regulator
MIKILVVEDQPRARRILAEAAQVAGANVQTAESAEEAIQAIAQDVFDVVITDLKMETDQAGFDVVKAAKEKDVLTQVIVITAYGKPQVSVTIMSLGAFDYLEKNAPGTDIFSMIKSKVTLALDYRTARLRDRG